MVEFKSPENGATLSFSVAEVFNETIDFYVEVKHPFGYARVRSSTHHSGSPAELFKSMASEWKGWKGEKVWSDLESSVVLTAKSDSMGHTKLEVKLTDYESNFKTVLIFEAGQLDRIANDLATLIPYSSY